MKKGYFIFCLIFSIFVNAQVINFPDANFKTKLMQQDVAFDSNYIPITLDANNNGNIEVSEVQGVIFLNVSHGNISDLTGINHFTNLWALDCSYNSLTNITVDNSIIIMNLNASHNALTSVNVNFGNFNQDYDPGLDLSYNNLATFSLSNVIMHDGFFINNNQLTSLTINNCHLGGFSVAQNNLSAINFTGNNSIGGYANFTYNQFTMLDLAGANIDYECNVILGNNIQDRIRNLLGGEIYYTSNNTFFDLGDYRGTTSCDPEAGGRVYINSCPNLETINFKNGYNHMFITCDEGGDIFQNPSISLQIGTCPNLTTICTDQLEKDTFQFWVDLLGLQNQITVNPNCSPTMATEELVLEQFTIFPVPTKDILQIHSNDSLEIKGITIYNNLGQMVQMEIGNQHEIDVSRLAKGAYYLKIKTDSLTSIKQFLKE
ncbi:T9SS type A sorting domain-containing protein [Flavobacterium wongokense]|uniref:T9SS type A sorting domain-containing protein n=1 Tax=Flavobacterium wongokense TaxID=2910674 RepID=UPI001F1F7D09|nr:T9SS type A sorting domain-containing protein [Flavobacterium sp. WG47]MCF6131115.1 T9SS type A sorting domain-containing protein [Flavobacterium sp. WG47]